MAGLPRYRFSCGLERARGRDNRPNGPVCAERSAAAKGRLDQADEPARHKLGVKAGVLFRRFYATYSVRVGCEAPGESTAGLRFAFFT
jgi:hypothetical protein